MKLAQTEVYEVATFYAHFDVVKEGETPPPPVTVRVCDSLSCALVGAERLFAELPEKLGPGVRVVRAPCMGACDRAPACAVGHVQVLQADVGESRSGGGEARTCTRLSDAECVRCLREETAATNCSRPALAASAAATTSSSSLATPACAASAAPAFPPGANGRWCAPSRRRACSRSIATKASPARSRIDIISSAIRTVSSRAC